MPESPITTVEPLPTAVVIHVLSRELRKDEVDAMCAEIDKARVAAPSLPFILDMSAVNFAGSMALGMLVGVNQEFRARNQRLIFAGLQRGARQAIEIAKINRIVEIMQDVPTAVKSVGGKT